ncbi:UrcA family protein [Parvularcula lutaonensis]|uniref:UrcA family protein n=1 Tax=Parvularcula lutaonensis TaxID=491923 RepID=A0ABV7MD30_9PROT|nr:UrcA family protein [Parvularcula lutaonensis]
MIATLLTAAILNAAHPAGAAEAKDFTFAFDENELRSEGAREALLDRLETKARRFCKQGERHGTPGHKIRRCTEDAIEGVITELDEPVLTAAYQDRARF